MNESDILKPSFAILKTFQRGADFDLTATHCLSLFAIATLVVADYYSVATGNSVVKTGGVA